MTVNVSSVAKWEADYQRGSDVWDLGGPTPVFRRLLQEGGFNPGRMIVLGAGRGYDAREFARYGFQVTAVDFSPSAAKEMQRLWVPDAPLEILRQDLFSLPGELNDSFDYVLEYTCYCAIDPQRRSEFVDLVARLLKPGGLYISLAFPLRQFAGGPPFSVSIFELLGLFRERDFKMILHESPPDSVRPRRGVEELVVFQKPDS